MLSSDIDVLARKIFDSRNEATIEILAKSSVGNFSASAPGGESKGKYEKTAFPKGVEFAISFVNAIWKKISSQNLTIDCFEDLSKIEEIIKKFDKNSLFGANPLYALEAVLLKVIAASHEQELWQFFCEKPKILPRPLGNIIGGGMHIKKEKKTDIQEFLVLPKTKHFFDAYFINLQAYKIAKKLILEEDKEYAGELTDEKSLAPTLDNKSVLEILKKVKEGVEEKFGIKIDIGVDIAASTLWRASNYYYKNKEKKLGREEQFSYITKLIKNYGLGYVEDPFHEDDFSLFSRLLKMLNKEKIKCMLAGDDLTATNFERVERAIKEKCISALIIKPNQIGSILETSKVVEIAKKFDVVPIISHRSGETYDNTITHLAVGWQVPIIKAGVLGKERFAKLHELLRIERKLAEK